MKFTTKTKDYHLMVRVKASFGESIDQEDLERFAQADIHGFFKPKMIKKRCVEYTGIPGMPLAEYLKEPVSKQEFFLVVRQLVSAGRHLWEKGLSIDNLVSDICQAYINKVTKEVQLIYLPVSSKQRQNRFMELMEAVVYAVVSSGDDAEYLSHFVHFLRSLGSIQKASMEELETYIANQGQSEKTALCIENEDRSEKSVSPGYKAPSESQRETETDDATRFEEEVYENEGVDEDDDRTVILDEGGTEFTELVQETPSGMPVLYRVSTGENICITKKAFRLGTEEDSVDYAVSDNHAVSRSHADIISKDEHYFVFDLGSKNKTYINNRALPSKYEVEINNGDILKLANEEFEFRTGKDER